MNKKNKITLLAVIILIMIATILTVSRAGHVAAVSPKAQHSDVFIDSPSAVNAVADRSTKSVDNDSMIISMAKLLAALAVVVAGIYGFLYLLRKMMGSKLSSNRNSRLIEVLETTYIAQKKSVSLIRFSDRSILVGISDGNITPLAELNPEETTRAMEESVSEKTSKGFKNILSEARDKIRAFSTRRMEAVALTDEVKGSHAI
jgi:flagellar biosynthetic protein FliO